MPKGKKIDPRFAEEARQLAWRSEWLNRLRQALATYDEAVADLSALVAWEDVPDHVRGRAAESAEKARVALVVCITERAADMQTSGEAHLKPPSA